jgi:hypothetical protein
MQLLSNSYWQKLERRPRLLSTTKNRSSPVLNPPRTQVMCSSEF